MEAIGSITRRGVRVWIEFREGKRHGFEISYLLEEGCDNGHCRIIKGKSNDDYWQDGKCVVSGYRKCKGDEYDGY